MPDQKPPAGKPGQHLEQIHTKEPGQWKKHLPSRNTVLAVLIVILALIAWKVKWDYDQKVYRNSLPVLTKNLKESDDDMDKINMAIIDLGKKGQAGQKATPLLLSYMNDRRWLVRFRAVEALGNIGEPDPRVLKAMAKALVDQNANVRSRALEALGNIGPRAKTELPEIFKMLSDEDKDVRLLAIKTVKSILADEVITLTPTMTPTSTPTPVMVKNKKGKKVAVVSTAKKAKKKGKKGAVQPKPTPTKTPILLPLVVTSQTYDELIKATQNDSNEVICETCKILGSIADLKKGTLGKKTAPVVSALIHLLSYPDPEVNDQAANALEKINNKTGQKQVARYRKFGRLKEGE